MKEFNFKMKDDKFVSEILCDQCKYGQEGICEADSAL